MVFSSLAWLHRASQLLSPCVAFSGWMFSHEKDVSVYFFRVLPVHFQDQELSFEVNVALVAVQIWLLGVWSTVLTEFSKVLYFPNSL